MKGILSKSLYYSTLAGFFMGNEDFGKDRELVSYQSFYYAINSITSRIVNIRIGPFIGVANEIAAYQ